MLCFVMISCCNVTLSLVRRWLRSAGLVFALPFLSTGETSSATNRFGFTGPEIFPIDPAVAQMRAGDLDGDGLQDLIVVNNARSKITLLFNQTGKTNQLASERKPVKREINELPPGSRFRIESISSEKRIASLVVTDLNADGRPDLAYYGEPKELVVQYNQGTNVWSAPRRWPIEDGQINLNALVSGDLNGDGRTDLVLLAENHVYLLAQKEGHSLVEPEKIPYSGTVKGIQVLDIDGDGLEDLMLVNWDSSNPLRFRLQISGGQLGPEIHFSLPPIRSYLADDLDGDHKTEIATIAQKSGRAQISNFIQKNAETLSGQLAQGQFQVLPLGKTTKARRGVSWADINGDQRTDLLVAQPDSGQLTVYFQEKDGRLAAPKTFPTLTGVSELGVADWDGDGVPEIFLLSADERQVGVTRLDKNGRVGFPTLIPFEGRPLALAIGGVQPGAKPSLAVLLDQDGKRTLEVRTADGKSTSQKLNESFKSNPSLCAVHDVDQDELADLVVLIPYEKIKILRQVPDRPFEEIDLAPPGGSAEQPWLSLADVDGDGKNELLLAQKNFLRAVTLKSEGGQEGAGTKSKWAFAVREQINGASSNSRIVGAAPLTNGVDAVAALFLLDAERKALTLSERDKAGVWQVTRNIELPTSEFTSLQAVGLGSAAANTLALVGLQAVAWLELSGKTWAFNELDSYETPIKDGYLLDVVMGDLNQDARKDLVFLETAKSYIDIVTFEAPHQLVPADRWQVFEERTFRNRRSEAPEPREALVVDLTGDKKNDLAVIVHDRILVYPQE
jgi:hypothetical protein